MRPRKLVGPPERKVLSTLSKPRNQKRNQSTEPPCDPMRIAGLVRLRSWVFNVISAFPIVLVFVYDRSSYSMRQ